MQEEYNPNLSNQPFGITVQPLPASNIENFNWDLWQTIKAMSWAIDIHEIQKSINEYDTIYRYLPIDENKRINFNPLGCVLGYGMVPLRKELEKLNLKIHFHLWRLLVKEKNLKKLKKLKKSRKKEFKKSRKKIKVEIKKLLKWLSHKKLNPSNLDKYSLVRYIEYFKHKTL